MAKNQLSLVENTYLKFNYEQNLRKMFCESNVFYIIWVANKHLDIKRNALFVDFFTIARKKIFLHGNNK